MGDVRITVLVVDDHPDFRARARIMLEADGFDVVDYGVGGADVDGSVIRGLADRIAAVGRTLVVASTAGAGTRVLAAIPCVS